jgi:hypothetical protein
VKFKNFESWSRFSGSPSYEEAFGEKYQSYLEGIEAELKREGHFKNYSPGDFWEALEDLNKLEKFEEDLEKYFEDNYHDFYYDKYDPVSDTSKMSDEHRRIKELYNKEYKEALRKLPSYQKTLSSTKLPKIDKMLVQNFFEKKSSGFKDIYKKWFQEIEKYRGKVAGKKFGF